MCVCMYVRMYSTHIMCVCFQVLATLLCIIVVYILFQSHVYSVFTWSKILTDIANGVSFHVTHIQTILVFMNTA